MHVERHTITVTTDGDGDFTGYTPVVEGRILQIAYTPDGASPLATGGVLTLTGEESGAAHGTITGIGTSAFTKALRQPTYSLAGAAALYAGSGTAVNTETFIANERLKLVIASGGANKIGVFDIFVG